MSEQAALECVERAGRLPEEIDLLVNAGVYRERNLAEPAFSTLIQRGIDANAKREPEPRRHGTFSFDVVDGGCGVLAAAELVDAFVGAGTAQLALIVASDIDPSPRTSHNFHFPPVGAALLLSHCETGGGFLKFQLRSFPEDAALFDAAIRWGAGDGPLRRARNFVDIDELPEFRERCVERAVTATSEFLRSTSLDPREVDLLVTSQYPPQVSVEVARGLGISEDRVAQPHEKVAGAHTAGPLTALDAAIESGAFRHAEHVLFVTVGAGIAVRVALYRHRAAARRERLAVDG